MKELIDYNPISGLKTYFVCDDHDESNFHIHYEQDVQPIIEHNKRLQNDDSYSTRGKMSGWWHAGNIPEIVILDWRTKYGVDIYNPNHTKYIMKLLRQPEYLYLRATRGYF